MATQLQVMISKNISTLMSRADCVLSIVRLNDLSRFIGLTLTSCVFMLIIKILKGSHDIVVGKCFQNQLCYLKESYIFFKILVTRLSPRNLNLIYVYENRTQ